MEINKIKTESIAHLSYLLSDKGEAVVIDPRRDAKIYMDKAKESGNKIKYIFETHRNEDLVTGSRELKRYTGAKILHGKGLDFQFGEFVEDGQTFDIGETVLKILETPGHTPESISIAVFPNKKCDKAVAVFTGDALFVDDVGRTDFFEDRKEEFAGMLYDSLHKKILPLGDQAVIYPAHGAGSVCGGGIADRELSTVGYEKAHNPRLQLSRTDFIKLKVNEKHQMPPYFKEMERVNLKGDDAALKNYKEFEILSPEELLLDFDNLQLIDVRSSESFLGCHIPKTVSIPLAMIGAYSGYFINYNTKIGLIADDRTQALNAKTELIRLGYNNVKGYLKGGVSAWETSGQSLESLKMVDVNDVLELKENSSPTFLDVRKPDEWENGILDGARTVFLGDVPDAIDELRNEKSIVTYCGSGKRATIAASLLAKNNIDNVSVFMGSMKAYERKLNE